MNLPQFLDDEKVEYRITSHTPRYSAQGLAEAEHTSGHRVAKPVIVKGDLGFAMCVVPACKRVNLDLVAEVLQEFSVRLATEEEMAKLFPNCEVGAEPPIGAMFGLKTIVDTELHEQEHIVMQAGSHTQSVQICRKDWERLCDPIIADITHA